MLAETIKNELISLADNEKATILASFFQTKKGQYAYGDLFLGVPVPQIRKTVTPYKSLQLKEIAKLLQSKFHECRFAALVLLVDQFTRGNQTERETIYNFYLSNTQSINNWDLVDVSAHKIVGAWLIDKNRSTLYNLAKSDSLWEQRIAIVSTLYFIRCNQFDDTIRLSELFLTHNHHLIHKACGWMLREVSKRDESILVNFLDKHASKMPRVMLRYSIEKLPEEKRKSYLRASIDV